MAQHREEGAPWYTQEEMFELLQGAYWRLCSVACHPSSPWDEVLRQRGVAVNDAPVASAERSDGQGHDGRP